MTFGSIPDNTQVISWLVVGFFSAWGGVVRYLMDISPSGKRWCWMAVISQVVISCFTGFLGGFYSHAQNNSVLMTLVIAGICSTLGSSLLRLLWRRVLQTSEKS